MRPTELHFALKELKQRGYIKRVDGEYKYDCEPDQRELSLDIVKE